MTEYQKWKQHYQQFFDECSEYRELPAMRDKTFQLSENKAWYEASTGLELARFYKTIKPRDSLPFRYNHFYQIAFKDVNSDDTIRNVPKIFPVHVDFAQQIPKVMAKLVFPKRPSISVRTGNESTDKELQKMLDKMLDENKIELLLNEAAEKLSYSGAIAFRFNLDNMESDYPILEVYPKEDIEIYKRYGNRIDAIIFKNYYRDKTKRYLLYTIYGKGFIDYRLYQTSRDWNNLKKEVELSSLEATKNLKPIQFINSDGTPSNKILAVYMENKVGAKSDYNGMIDEFVSLDEIRSNLILFLRTAKIKQYIHSNLLQENENGQQIVPDSYDTDTIVVRDSNPNWTESEIKRDIPDIANSVQGFKNAFEDILLQCLTSLGLSPATMGYDISGANSSALALNIRERMTLHTRESKLQSWTVCLQEMVKMLFIYAFMMKKSDKYVVPDVDYIDSIITFAEYGRDETELVDDLIKRLDAQLIDIYSAYEALYPDKTEEERKAMIELALNLIPEIPEVSKEDYTVEPKETEDIKTENTIEKDTE